jgi:hypothetical protein
MTYSARYGSASLRRVDILPYAKCFSCVDRSFVKGRLCMRAPVCICVYVCVCVCCGYIGIWIMDLDVCHGACYLNRGSRTRFADYMEYRKKHRG